MESVVIAYKCPSIARARKASANASGVLTSPLYARTGAPSPPPPRGWGSTGGGETSTRGGGGGGEGGEGGEGGGGDVSFAVAIALLSLSDSLSFAAAFLGGVGSVGGG